MCIRDSYERNKRGLFPLRHTIPTRFWPVFVGDLNQDRQIEIVGYDDNQVFVIGGSFTDDESDLVNLLNERIGGEAKFKLEHRSFPAIHIAQLKSDAGIIGASFLVQ